MILETKLIVGHVITSRTGFFLITSLYSIVDLDGKTIRGVFCWFPFGARSIERGSCSSQRSGSMRTHSVERGHKLFSYLVSISYHVVFKCIFFV